MDWSGGKGCNGLGSGAVGYWGRDVFRRVNAEQEHAKQRVLLTDQIKAGGIRFEMWRGVTSGQRCSCYKEVNRSSEDKCQACHGMSYVPGYLKFGYNTLWMSAVDADITFTNTEITTDFKSSKVVLSSGALTGTVESGDKPFSRSVLGSVWEYDAQTYVRIAGQSSVTVKYSLDSGFTWSDMSDLVSANPASGVIRFKVILERSFADVLSPLFEIVRARYATIGLSVEQPDGSYRMGPWLLLMRNIPIEKKTKNEYGDLMDQGSLKAWTTGLSFFDPSVVAGSMDELIRSKDTIFRAMDGVQTGNVYKVTDWQNSDPFGYILVDQTFTLRKTDPVGPYSLIW